MALNQTPKKLRSGSEKVKIEVIANGKSIVKRNLDLKNFASSKRGYQSLSVKSLTQTCFEDLISSADYRTGKGNLHIPQDFLVSNLSHDNEGKTLFVHIDCCKHLFQPTDAGDIPTKLFFRIKEFGSQLGYKIPILIPFFIACIWIGTYKPHDSDKVCFTKIGCFPLGYPWSQRSTLLNFVPQSPSAINTNFTLYSENIASSFSARNYENILTTINVDWNKNICIIIHGYMDDTTTWVSNLKNAVINKFKKESINVLTVDWRYGARMYYPQSVANTRIVGTEISMVLQYIAQKFTLSYEKVHLVGHSLGSHISGYVGKRLQGIGKITALDPAFPLFDGYNHSEIGLHKSDANIVEVFHSNIGPFGFGLRDSVGTIDIYLNNGQNQPGCQSMNSFIKSPMTVDGMSGIQDVIACSHRRAYEVYIDLLLRPPMHIFRCSSLNSLKNGYCFKNNLKDHTFTFPNEITQAGTFFMPTSAEPPFCNGIIKMNSSTCDSQIPIFNTRLKLYLHDSEFLLFEGTIISGLVIEKVFQLKCSILDATNKLSIKFSTAEYWMRDTVCLKFIFIEFSNGISSTTQDQEILIQTFQNYTVSL